MRYHLEAAVEGVLASSGVLRVARACKARRTLILAYHNVVPAGESLAGERSLHVEQRRFGEQLDQLAVTHDVIALGEIWASPRSRRPRVVLTFDDAYRGAVSAGVAEVVRRGLPATIFVAPGLLGSTGFWWDELADPDSGTIPPSARELCIEELKGRDDLIRVRATDYGWELRATPAHAWPCSVEELAMAVSQPGITLGAHSWSHVNLAKLSTEELGDELERPLEWLRHRFPECSLRWLAYPYGRYSIAVQKLAARSGYAGAVRNEGGWVGWSRSTDTHCLPRRNVSAAVSLPRFRLAVAGFPLA